MKLRWKIALAAVAPLVIVSATAPLWIDRVVRLAIHDEATNAVGVACELEGVDVSIFGAACTMENFTVANPEGFDASEPFLQMGRAHVAVSARSLAGDEVEIPELTIEDLELNLERRGLEANYRVILANLAKSGDGPSRPGKKFVIREVALRNIRVRARVSAIGIVKPSTHATIDEIRFQNVGSDTGGAALAKVIRRVITALLAGVAQSGIGLPKEIAEGLGDGLRGVAGAGLLGVKVAGGIGKAVGKGITGGISGVLGRKDEETEGADDGEDE